MNNYMKKNKSYADFGGIKEKYKQIYLTHSWKLARDIQGPVQYVLQNSEENQEFFKRMVFEKSLR